MYIVYLPISFDISGGTSVSGALECPAEERRMIVSLDTSQMVKFVKSYKTSKPTPTLEFKELFHMTTSNTFFLWISEQDSVD